MNCSCRKTDIERKMSEKLSSELKRCEAENKTLKELLRDMISMERVSATYDARHNWVTRADKALSEGSDNE